MPQPPVVRRVKSYSGESGYVYQYYFHEIVKSQRGGQPGNEYVYMVSADRKTQFPLRIFVSRAAVDAWARTAGRELTGTEEYAAAKMRLFQAFDGLEDLATEAADLRVDESNLDTLLDKLGM